MGGWVGGNGGEGGEGGDGSRMTIEVRNARSTRRLWRSRCRGNHGKLQHLWAGGERPAFIPGGSRLKPVRGGRWGEGHARGL